MERVDIPPHTWGYKNFINEEEKQIFLKWALKNINKLNNNGYGRYYSTVNNWDDLPLVYYEIKKRIVNTEKISKYFKEKNFGDFLSMNFEGGSISPHSDPNDNNCVHTRYNLLISLPYSGGEPVYDNKTITVEEKMLWRCQAGLFTHESLPVRGSKPRINLSFGFQIPIDS